MKYGNRYRVMMFCLVCVLVVSINPLGAFAAEYFVATTGNNSNSGTIGSPFLTLEKAASVMSSGDTMFIRGGTYQRTAWILNVPSGGGSWATATVVKAYQNETVIITPQNPAQNGTDVIQISPGKSYIIFDGLILDGLRSGTTLGGRMGMRFQVSGTSTSPSHHIRLINMEIRNTFNSGILTTDAHSNEYINSSFHHANTNDPESTFQGPYGIYVQSANNLFMGCDFFNNQGWGIQHYSGHDFKPNNNTYIGNRFYNNGRSGIIIGPSTGTVLINNLFFGNGTGFPNGYTGPSRAGIDLWNGVQNLVAYNNTSYGNVAGEFLDSSTADSPKLIRNNIFFATSSSHRTVAIASGSNGVTLTNNLIYHANPNMRILNQGNATIANNINGNPLFVNASNADFHLQSGSPAIGKGVVLKEVKTDFDKEQREDPFDVGAYVFGGSFTLPDTTPPLPPKNVRIQ